MEIHNITKNLQKLSEELLRVRGEHDRPQKIDPSALPVESCKQSKEASKGKAGHQYNLVQEDAKMIVGMRADNDKQALVVDQPEDDDASSVSSETSYSGGSSSSHISEISFVDPNEWDTDKWYQSIRGMFDKLQNKQEWDMMMLLRKTFDGRHAERQQAFEKIQELDEQRKSEAEYFQEAQEKFDRTIEDLQMNVFSSLSGFDSSLRQKTEQAQEIRERKRRARKKNGHVGFDLHGKHAGRKHILWADQDDKKGSEGFDPRANRKSKAGDLLQIIAGQQNQIAALKTSVVQMQTKVATHKQALRHIETTEKTGLEVEISEEVQEVLISVMAKVATPKPSKAGEMMIDMSQIVASAVDSSFTDHELDKNLSTANRELMREIIGLREQVKTVQDSLGEFMNTRGSKAGIAKRKRKARESRAHFAIDPADMTQAAYEKPVAQASVGTLFTDMEALPLAERFTKLQGKLSQLNLNILKRAEEEKATFEASILAAEIWKKKLVDLQAPAVTGENAPETTSRAAQRRKMSEEGEKPTEEPVQLDLHEMQRRRAELKKKRKVLIEANSEKDATEEALSMRKSEWQQLASNLNSAFGEAPPKSIEEGKLIIEMQDDELQKLTATLQQLKQKRGFQLSQAGNQQTDTRINSKKRQMTRGKSEDRAGQAQQANASGQVASDTDQGKNVANSLGRSGQGPHANTNADNANMNSSSKNVRNSVGRAGHGQQANSSGQLAKSPDASMNSSGKKIANSASQGQHANTSGQPANGTHDDHIKSSGKNASDSLAVAVQGQQSATTSGQLANDTHHANMNGAGMNASNSLGQADQGQNAKISRQLANGTDDAKMNASSENVANSIGRAGQGDHANASMNLPGKNAANSLGRADQGQGANTSGQLANNTDNANVATSSSGKNAKDDKEEPGKEELEEHRRLHQQTGKQEKQNSETAANFGTDAESYASEAESSRNSSKSTKASGKSIVSPYNSRMETAKEVSDEADLYASEGGGFRPGSSRKSTRKSTKADRKSTVSGYSSQVEAAQEAHASSDAPRKSKSSRKSSVSAHSSLVEASLEASASNQVMNHLLEVKRENMEIGGQVRVYKDLLNELQKKGKLTEEDIKMLSALNDHGSLESEQDVHEEAELKEIKLQVKKLQRMLKEKRQQWDEGCGEQRRGESRKSFARSNTRKSIDQVPSSESQRQQLDEEDGNKRSSVRFATDDMTDKDRPESHQSAQVVEGEVAKNGDKDEQSHELAITTSEKSNLQGRALGKSFKDIARNQMLLNSVKKAFQDATPSSEGNASTSTVQKTFQDVALSLQGRAPGDDTQSQSKDLVPNSHGQSSHAATIFRAANVSKFANNLKKTIHKDEPKLGDLLTSSSLPVPPSSQGEKKAIHKDEPKLDDLLTVSHASSSSGVDFHRRSQRSSTNPGHGARKSIHPGRTSEFLEEVSVNAAPRRTSEGSDKLDLHIGGTHASSKEVAASPDEETPIAHSSSIRRSQRRFTTINHALTLAKDLASLATSDVDETPLMIKAKRSSLQADADEMGEESV